MKHILYLIFISINVLSMGLPSEYYKIKDTKKMKQYFISYILDITKKENNKILRDRYFIKNIYPNISRIPKYSRNYKRFESITKRYKLSNKSTFKDYLKTIDVIPNSLVIAQAIVESGWGKSRFTKQANNIFGQWTWSGKGLTPINRDAGKKHMIKIFPSIKDSVKGYMINLNLGWGYKEFRTLRVKIRKNRKEPTGIVLSDTLINYSQKREKYVKILKNLIKRNKLIQYDRYLSL
ncbi:MAG: glucosaminidase domain-containing protein [Arcobacteraceae bacterium]|nr:glucosaminidase domain-containing protein [Arcobacteraceae bacterium]